MEPQGIYLNGNWLSAAQLCPSAHRYFHMSEPDRKLAESRWLTAPWKDALQIGEALAYLEEYDQ
jgi:hypothetical protein